ncbi:hypothetical protein T492DRAFT_849101 [Pavlovales sp. CCMP2436]|nr:hypothetical protein T492DRAFT_849101 [Pavlovales sp. CCMP2436]
MAPIRSILLLALLAASLSASAGGLSNTAPYWDDLFNSSRVPLRTSAARACEPGCEAHGNCNLWTGECDCPHDWHGRACERLSLPACGLGAPGSSVTASGNGVPGSGNGVSGSGNGVPGSGNGVPGSAADVRKWMASLLQIGLAGSPYIGPISCDCLRQAVALRHYLHVSPPNHHAWNSRWGVGFSAPCC